MTRRSAAPAAEAIDRELSDLSPPARWRVWMERAEAIIFAAAEPVSRAALARAVGADCPVEALIDDIRAELRDRPYDIVAVAGGWRFRTRPRLGPLLRAVDKTPAAAVPPLNAADLLLLAAVAYHQPATRRDIEGLLGRAVSADAVARLRAAGLVGPGPRDPRPGAPATIVTTDGFLDYFGLESLADLPDVADLQALGLADGDIPGGVLYGVPAADLS